MISMEGLTKDKIKYIRDLITRDRENFNKIFENYRTNIRDINTTLGEIELTDWEDDMSTAYATYRDSLKTGVVQKLNNSIQTGGTAEKFLELIDRLKEECDKYLAGMTDTNKPADTSASTVDPFEGLDTDQTTVISEIIDALAKLRFDNDVELNITPVPEVETKTVVINQFDRVKVKIDGEERVMYYLGTDSKGRSYFSETLDDNAVAYVSVWPGAMGTTDADINHWAEQYSDNPYLYSSMMQSQALFVATGGNTGTLTKGNVLKKLFGSYANGQYVGDANFNNSIVFENSYYAPEVVERGSNQYDAANSYHVLNLNNTEKVSFSDVKSGEVSLSSAYHPDIELKPGEKINVSYTELLILTTNCTIGSDTESVLLHYDEDEGKYYVVNKETGGYHTAVRENDATDYGYRSITIDKLNEALQLGGHSF